MKHNVYRDGEVHVLSEMCATCVFRPGNLMKLHAGRLRGMIEDAKRGDSAIVCHSTLYNDEDNAVCRGYFDRHADDVASLQLAKAIGIIVEDPPPT